MNIILDNISKKYKKKHALKSFSAELNQGIYGLLGANGAGKTTLLNVFVGILKSDTGNIFINGKNVKNLGSEFLSHIGYLPQYPTFYKNFEVLEFLKYMCAIKDIPHIEGMKRAKELLDIVNLRDVYNKKIGALSGGMRQRVGIVQALLGDPEILILDEPTAGLDPRERIRFRNLISKFSENRIVLLATHIVSDVEFIANQVMILREGQLIKYNTPVALIKEIEGKVWTVMITNDKIDDKYETYKISNILRDNNNILLRIISNEKPDEKAKNVKPNLEDVFLYYFGEDNLC